MGWSTHGHSGVDVNLYGYPPDLTKELFGNRENTEVRLETHSLVSDEHLGVYLVLNDDNHVCIDRTVHR